MFTGIVRALGEVTERRPGHLRIAAPISAAIGASVAVNGACLTVVDAGSGTLAFDVVPETERRTNLGRLSRGSRVNLEPAVSLQDPLDGHLVQGHVDGTAGVLERREVGLGRELTIELPAALARYVAEKGSIAVDGTSLTVARVAGGYFEVALIPHTLASTVAGDYAPGSVVNLEVDVMARYAERLLGVK